MNIQIYISSLEADLLAPGSPARPRDLWSETLYSNYFGNIDNSIARNNIKYVLQRQTKVFGGYFTNLLVCLNIPTHYFTIKVKTRPRHFEIKYLKQQ